MPNPISPQTYLEENDTLPYAIHNAETNTTAFIGVTQMGNSYAHRPTLVTSWDDFIMKFGYYTEDTPFMAPAVSAFFLNGGEKAYIVKVHDDSDISMVGIDKGKGNRTGLQSLLDLDTISIVLVPGITRLAVMKACIEHCEHLGNRIVIFDTPENMTSADDLIHYVANAVSDDGFSVLYTPWYKSEVAYIEAPHDKVGSKKLFIPPSGAMAGLYAKTDRERGVHKVPANMEIEGALALKVNYPSDEQSILNLKGVNCIRMFPEKGIVVWGARTTATKQEWKYISIRRFLIFIKVSILQSTEWVVFEENTHNLWERLKRMIESFLLGQWRKGRLMGSTPNEAYFVKCGYQESMTAEDIAKGSLICLIGVSLLRPAEFMIERIEWKIDTETVPRH